jgi:ribokinase
MSISGAGRVIVVGSINVDVVLRLPALPGPGETVLGGELARHHGGKGANQAVAAARAGGHVHMIGAVGADDGTDSLRELAAEGIEVTQVQPVAGLTGLAVVLVDERTSENMIAVASGANGLVTPEVVTAALIATELQPEDVVVLSFELPGPSLERAADVARAADARIVVNPAPAQPTLAGVMAGAIVTPNQHEAAAYVEGEQTGRGRRTVNAPPALGLSAVDMALRLSGQTGGAVLVTLGADGALLAADGRTEHFAGHRVAALDTTGAGDTLTGVLAAGLAAGHPLREAVRRAVAAAALSVTKAGARAGMPSADEIEALAGTVS